jgi:hypothetical protein
MLGIHAIPLKRSHCFPITVAFLQHPGGMWFQWEVFPWRFFGAFVEGSRGIDFSKKISAKILEISIDFPLIIC